MTDAEARGASSAADPTTGRFRATPWITHERLDDEVIAINLETGEYFALDDVAADAWTLLTAGVGLEDAAGVLAERYDVGAERVRADLSAFFLVAAGSAAIGVLVPGWVRALLVPAALYGTALAGRLFGAASGDPVNSGIAQSMIIEALTVLLMVGGWWVLSRPPVVTAADPIPAEPPL